MEVLMIALLALNLALGIILLLVLLRRSRPEDTLSQRFESMSAGLESLGKQVREENLGLRAELGRLNAEQRMELNQNIGSLSEGLKNENRGHREELTSAQNNLSESLSRRMKELSEAQHNGLETLRTSIEARLEQIRANNETRLEAMRRTVDEKLHETLEKRLTDSFKLVSERLEEMQKSSALETRSNREELNTTLKALREQINKDSLTNREELSKALNNLSESLTRRVQDLSSTQQASFETLKTTLDARMEQIRSNNETKLEEMRRTVDEKLHETLEKRLGEHFNQVSDRLEKVHRTMGEVQSLTKSVGKLEQIMGNVKNRGVMGEVQLATLLQDIMLPGQYETNFKPRARSNETVEFAIRLPGPDEDQKSVYLPMDSKFPVEDYQHLLDAYEANDPIQIVSSRKAMADRIKACARDIRDKYINPPVTTDFGLLFLPFEGLYAEALRITGLFETLIREQRVVICGPTTTAALVNSLQMGFRTLAIQKKTAEAWKVLTAVKHDFGKFATLLDQTQKKLHEASKHIETATDRTRQIEKKLSKVQELPDSKTEPVLELDSPVLVPPEQEV